MRTPSTKVSLILFVTVLIVVGTILLNISYQDEGVANKEELKLTVGVNLESNLSDDNDGDGLLNWEEALWSTDPNVADTDGDGIDDGDEVNTNRNPLNPGPNDENHDLAAEIIEELESIPLDEDSLTNRIGRNFIESYFTLRNQEGLTPEAKEQLVEMVVQQTLNEVTIDDARYSENQFIIFDSSDKEKLAEYGNKMFNIMFLNLNPFEEATTTNNYDGVSEILYSMSQEFLFTEVPDSIISTHTELTNNYLVLSQSVSGAEKDQTDPILASTSLYLYASVQEKIDILTEDIALFLNQSGIIYKDGEFNIESND